MSKQELTVKGIAIARFDLDFPVYVEDENALAQKEGEQCAIPIIHVRLAVINNEPGILLTMDAIRRADIDLRLSEGKEDPSDTGNTRRLAI